MRTLHVRPHVNPRSLKVQKLLLQFTEQINGINVKHIRIYPYNMHQQDALFSIDFNNKPLHVSSRLAAHHRQDQLCINSSWYSQALCWLTAGCSQSI